MKKSFNIVYVAFTLFLIITIFAISSSSVLAEENEGWPEGPFIVAESAILMEASTGAVLFEKNMNNKMYPASITKILTALIAIENSSLEDTVTYSSEAINSLSSGAANVGLKPGDTLSMEESLYALMLPSANEVANGIAEHVAGSMDAFSQLMNQRAKDIGARNSNFTNPSGLFDSDHYTTSYDMALIMKECLNNQTFMNIDSSVSYTLPIKNEEKPFLEIINRNNMLIPGNRYYYNGIIGGKTGYLSQAGRTLISVARRDGMTLISVIMKSTTENQFSDATLLLDYGFNNFTLKNISENETHFSSSGINFLSYAGSIMDENISSSFSIPTTDQIVLPKGVSFFQVNRNLTLLSEKKAPAEIQYYYVGVPIGKATIQNISISTPSEGSPFLKDIKKSNPPGLNWQIRINLLILLGVLLLFFILLFAVRLINTARFSKTIKRKIRSRKRRKLHF